MMSLKAFYLRTACVLVALAWVSAVDAAPRNGYSLTGNGRGQIGDGLPIPIGTATPAPDGKVFVKAGAVLQQTTGPDPKQIEGNGPVQTYMSSATQPVFGFNTSVYQVRTNLIIGGPTAVSNGTNALRKGGRTGPATVTWCPHRPLPTASFNPGCVTPAAASNPVPGGRLTYTKTTNQFGGAGTSTSIVGTADIALRGGTSAPPCTITVGGSGGCIVVFALATPANTQVGGGPFGTVATTGGMTPAMGRYHATVQADGAVVAIGNLVASMPAGAPNPATSYGAPITTGMITVTASALGSNETFTETGSDGRVSGVGTLSLVNAGVSQRALTGPNSNRGWVNYTIPEPTTVAGAAAALAVLFGCHSLVRRRR
jgi:hypothetical protein